MNVLLSFWLGPARLSSILSGSIWLGSAITLVQGWARRVRTASFVYLPRPGVEYGDGLDINPRLVVVRWRGTSVDNPRWHSNRVALLLAVRPRNTALGIAPAHAEPLP
jgi:hypothetical protein